MTRWHAAPTALSFIAGLGGCGARTGLEGALPDGGAGASDRPTVCVEAPAGGPGVSVDLSADTRVGAADVVFLLDVSESMGPEMEAIQLALEEIILPGFLEAIPDVEIGVAAFADFPVNPYGAVTDVPYLRVADVTDDVGSVREALAGVTLKNGGDRPESQVEALYQVATGAGLDPWVDAVSGPPHTGGGVGFRAEAMPIVVIVTDAAFHGGPAGLYPYEGLSPAPHSWTDTLDALAALGAEVMALDTSGADLPTATTDLQATATALGTVDRGGTPLVVGVVAASELADAAVQLLTTLATDVRLDVDAVVEDVPGDEVDGRALVTAIRPLSAEPASGVASVDDFAFHAVLPGTRLTFTLTIADPAIPPAAAPLVVPVRVVVRANLRATIAVLRVDIVVPSLEGAGCGS